jgi:hypothetical protein
LQQAAQLPDNVSFDFDPAREEAFRHAASHVQDSANPEPTAVVPGHVVKTVRRTVVTLEHGCFQARETVRQQTTTDGQRVLERSAQLADLVPRGGRYAFDLIVYVGLETYLHGRSLEDVQQTLAERQPAIHVPLSTLWDQQHRFLFCVGRLHERATPRSRIPLPTSRRRSWLLDGTLEPDTPVFLGLEDAMSGMFLGGWKIPSENADDIAVCLTEAAARFGPPAGVLHDLSAAMIGACDAALPGVAHRVCHFHLARDVGNDLFASDQIALTKRHRSLKILPRLREQRKGQTEWFRERFDQPAAELVLNRLLAGESLESVRLHESQSTRCWRSTTGFDIDDGRRRGFPIRTRCTCTTTGVARRRWTGCCRWGVARQRCPCCQPQAADEYCRDVIPGRRRRNDGLRDVRTTAEALHLTALRQLPAVRSTKVRGEPLQTRYVART